MFETLIQKALGVLGVLKYIDKAIDSSIGGMGTVLITSTKPSNSRRFKFLVVSTDAVFATLKDEKGLDQLDAIRLNFGSDTITANTIVRAIKGNLIQEVALTSGTVIGVLA